MILIGVLVSALMEMPLVAQNRRWADPYQRGQSAFNAGRYDEAIQQFERAVAVDPRSGANKLVEGVFRINYFPYAYLALAYLRTNQLEKAQENFERARKDRLPGDLATRVAAGEKELAVVLSARNAPPPSSPPPSAPPPAPAAAPAPARNANFDRGLQQVESALSARQYDAAIKALDALRGLDAAEYARQKLPARRDEAAGAWGRQLADEGSRLLQEGKINEAKTRLQQADQLAPGLGIVQEVLAEVRRREDNYQRLKSAGIQASNANNLQAARDNLEKALEVHPEQFLADNLGANLSAVREKLASSIKPATPTDDAAKIAATAADVNRRFADLVNQSRIARKQGDIGGAIQRLQDARTADKGRFDREKLDAELEALIAETAADPESKALREALLALLRGDAKASSDLLEPLVAKPRNPKSTRLADLQAYLGVAYATRALTATREEEQKQLGEKAMQYFRLARAARRDYRLSARLVSPKIVAMFDQAQP
jgi:tetratricopeptide (TPR) repeat protein